MSVRRFLDSLLGRTRTVAPKSDRLFAMSTAMVTLQAQLDLTPGDHAGIAFQAVESNYFTKMSVDLDDLLNISTRDTGTQFTTETDKFNYRWVNLQDEQFEDLVATIHIISETLIENGFGDQLLAALFRFTDTDRRAIYWIYNFKRGLFYPFVPSGERQRNNALELRLSSAMEKELPIEPELERWYPLWGTPF